MTIDDMDGVRARLDESLGSEGLLTAFRPLRADLRALLDDHARLAAEVAGWRKGAAAEAAEADRLRGLLDVIDQACGHNRPERCAESLAAEIERLTSERNFYRGERDAHHAIQMERTADVARLTRERDDARSALSVRYALAREVEALLGIPEGPAGPEQGFRARVMERAFKRAADAEARAYAAEADSAKLRAALEAIMLLDRSKPYEYGERRPSDGASPPDGRWITPREKAALALGGGAPPPGERERLRAEAEHIERGGR